MNLRKTRTTAATDGSSRVGVALGAAKRLVPAVLRPGLGRYEPQYPPRPLTVPRGYTRATAPPDPPAISIFTPTLNQGRFIRATFASVAMQRYPNLEYLVADGGSEDDTLEAVEEYRRHIDHFDPGPDDGQIGAINRGLGRASGEILAWLNSDDLLLPGALAQVSAYFATHPEVDLVYGYRVLIDDAGCDVGVWTPPPHSDAALRWVALVPQETAFWRKELWHRLGGVTDEFEVAFDWDFFCRAAAAGARIARIPRFLGAQRQHAGQKARRREALTRADEDRMRERWTGRPVGRDEMRAGLLVHLARSLPAQYRHTVWGRVGLGRVRVSLPPTRPAAP